MDSNKKKTALAAAISAFVVGLISWFGARHVYKNPNIKKLEDTIDQATKNETANKAEIADLRASEAAHKAELATLRAEFEAFKKDAKS